MLCSGTQGRSCCASVCKCVGNCPIANAGRSVQGFCNFALLTPSCHVAGDAGLRKHFEKTVSSTGGSVQSVKVAMRKGPDGKALSMGFGFVKCSSEDVAKAVVRQLQVGIAVCSVGIKANAKACKKKTKDLGSYDIGIAISSVTRVSSRSFSLNMHHHVVCNTCCSLYAIPAQGNEGHQDRVDLEASVLSASVLDLAGTCSQLVSFILGLK